MRGDNKGESLEKLSGGFLERQGTRGDMAVKVRPDEMSEATQDLSTHPRPWTKLPRNRQTKLAVMGLGKEYLEKGDPRYKRAMELANKYRKARTKELSAIHGFVSSGASALLSTASLALAASRFLYEKAAESGDVDIMRKAATMADSARQAELAAWELAAREGTIKRRMDQAGAAAPWVRTEEKGKPGRKTNRERAEAASIPELPSKREATLEEVLTVTGVEVP